MPIQIASPSSSADITATSGSDRNRSSSRRSSTSFTAPNSRARHDSRGTVTATWTVEWTAPALGDGGTFTETRQTVFTTAVGEFQVLN